MTAALSSANPLLQPTAAPYHLPDFSRLEPAHFVPALEQAMADHLLALDALATQAAAPDFDNTVAAFDRAGHALDRLDHLLGQLAAATASPALDAVHAQMSGALAAHRARVGAHAGVFQRLDALHARRADLALAPDQRRLLERLHGDFLRAGARLPPAAQARCAALLQEEAELGAQFVQNVMADEASFGLALQGEADLAGLPAAIRDATRAAAQERGLPEGSHLLTLGRSHVEPFLAFSDRRDLREQVWRAFVGRGGGRGTTDNRPVAARMLALRQELATLHGHACYADFELTGNSMAGSAQSAQDLLTAMWQRALPALAREQALLEAARAQAGDTGPLQPWDWAYWSEKVRQQRFAVDESALKPYFTLPGMVAAMFEVAQRLFGLTLAPRHDLPLLHPDVQAWTVSDRQGQAIGLFLLDPYARAGKQSGAWMTDFQLRCANRGVDEAVVLNTSNFARGVDGQPCLLSFDDVRTLFHEFGHGLHGLLSQARYASQAGTNVLRDWVELPSQLLEHWASDPELLRRHARHWQTGEPLPLALLEGLQRARHWGEGFTLTAYLASALVDMALHRLPQPPAAEALEDFERELLQGLGMPPVLAPRHGVLHFQHLFSGPGYAAGYYVYLWAEVLDADAFEAFKEAGDLYHPEVAERLHRLVYASGDTLDPQQAYREFRGRLPALEPLLAKRGLLPA
ncbi:M3 family metallopeptidase [Ideonella sp. TBM-1]|uniref:M3 family metallopeptidase n=1 Tax=Ideonella livida TaxID=2707176 RepID=A0A7C9PG65_9BURK|nr:M3 family metallopeptidase [Ideonella livida]